MTDRFKAKKDVFNIIARRNRNNPVLSHEIESCLGLCGPAVRDIVRELRRAGEPIVASDKGYYLAHTAEEVGKIVKDLQRRIESMGKTIAEIKRRSYERFGRQTKFDFEKGSGRVQGVSERETASIHSDSEEEGIKKGVFPVRVDHKEDAFGHVPGNSEAFSLDLLLQS